METSFPASATSIGKKVEYLSQVLVPAGRTEEYITLMGQILDENIRYIDPVHELRGREAVLTMLAKYVPRVVNSGFTFDLVVDGAEQVIWRWTIVLKIRFSWFKFTINGLVHATVREGKIVYQREYYDPMESIGVIPVVGRIYKLILKMG